MLAFRPSLSPPLASCNDRHSLLIDRSIIWLTRVAVVSPAAMTNNYKYAERRNQQQHLLLHLYSITTTIYSVLTKRPATPIQRFMAAWRKEEVDAAMHRQEIREVTRLGKLYYSTRKRRTCEATPIPLVDESKEPCMGTRRTGNWVALRHVDASRDSYVIFYERGGVGGGAARLSLFVIFFLYSRARAGLAIV